MVANVTSLTRSGLSDFVVQRVSAAVLGLYALCVAGYLLVNPDVTHSQLVGYFGSTSMSIFSTFAILSLLGHAWIGMWTIGTDYLLPWSLGAKATVLRLTYQSLVSLALLLYTAWGMSVIWGLE